MLELADVSSLRPVRSESGQYRFATEPWQVEAARRIRHQVFVREQGVFQRHDRDDIDRHALTIIAIHRERRMPERVASTQFDSPKRKGSRPAIIGTVRIHCDGEPGVWHGSRLAVLRNHRGAAVTAASLIRKAVASACAIGCEQFLARIQPQNQKLFERIGWQVLREVTLQNRSHLLVEAQLDRFRPEDFLNDTEIEWARYLGAQVIPTFARSTTDAGQMQR